MSPRPSVRICGLTTLWPAVGPADIDGAIDQVTTSRALYGSAQNRFETVVMNETSQAK